VIRIPEMTGENIRKATRPPNTATANHPPPQSSSAALEPNQEWPARKGSAVYFEHQREADRGAASNHPRAAPGSPAPSPEKNANWKANHAALPADDHVADRRHHVTLSREGPLRPPRAVAEQDLVGVPIDLPTHRQRHRIDSQPTPSSLSPPSCAEADQTNGDPVRMSSISEGEMLRTTSSNGFVERSARSRHERVHRKTPPRQES